MKRPGTGPPYLVDDAERRVTVLHGIGNDAHGQQIVYLIEGALLLLNLQVQRVQPLGARLHFGGNAAFDHLSTDRILHFDEKLIEDFLFRRHFLLQFEKRFGFEKTEGKVLKFAADETHPKAIGDRRVNIERLTGDALLASGVEIFERAHVVQAVSKFHENHADIVHHRQEHFADVFGLAGFGSEQIETANLGDALDQAGDIGPEFHGDFFEGDLGVLDDIM